jgi:hypothetical protein
MCVRLPYRTRDDVLPIEASASSIAGNLAGGTGARDAQVPEIDSKPIVRFAPTVSAGAASGRRVFA